MEKIEIKPNEGQLITSFYSISDYEMVKFRIDKKELEEIVKHNIMQGFVQELKKKDMVIKSEPRGAETLNTAQLYVFTPKELQEFITGIQQVVLKFADKKIIVADGRD